jgi:hypothetical protein
MRASLLAACWALAASLVCQGQTADSGDRTFEIERAVNEALTRPINVDFRGMPLSDAVAAINQSCGVAFMLDHLELEQAGVAEDTKIQVAIPAATADTALAVMLRSLELTWVVRDGQAMVTTVSNAETIMEMRVYPVYDLVVAHDEKGAYADFDSLIDVVTSTIAPTTWSEVGGAGNIKSFFNSQSIVVSQTREVHRELEALLASLRRARDVQGFGSSAVSVPRSGPSYVQPRVPSTSASMPATLLPASASPVSRLVRVYD